MQSFPGFVRASQAWSAQTSLAGCAERVSVAMFQGTQRVSRGELVIEWASAEEGLELRARQAGFELLTRDFSGLLRHLTRIDRPIAPDDFCALLLRLGYADMTVAEKPANVVGFGRPA